MLKYLIIAATFLAITLGVVLLRTGNDPSLYNNAVFVSAPEVKYPPTSGNGPARVIAQPARVAPSLIPTVASAHRPPPRIRDASAQIAVATPAATPQNITSQDDLLRTITSGAFAGMTTVAPGSPTPTTPAEPSALQAMIIQSLRDESTAQPGFTTTTPATARQSVAPVQRIEATTYVVKRGDSLGSIASHFYGRKEDYYRIYEANKSRLSSPDSIRVGQKLTIPKS